MATASAQLKKPEKVIPPPVAPLAPASISPILDIKEANTLTEPIETTITPSGAVPLPSVNVTQTSKNNQEIKPSIQASEAAEFKTKIVPPHMIKQPTAEKKALRKNTHVNTLNKKTPIQYTPRPEKIAKNTLIKPQPVKMEPPLMINNSESLPPTKARGPELNEIDFSELQKGEIEINLD